MVFLTSPNNPDGSMMSEVRARVLQCLAGIGRVCYPHLEQRERANSPPYLNLKILPHLLEKHSAAAVKMFGVGFQRGPA